MCSNDPGEPLRIFRGEQFCKEHHEVFNGSPCWVFFGEEEDFGIGTAGEPNHQKRHAAAFASTKDSLDVQGFAACKKIRRCKGAIPTM